MRRLRAIPAATVVDHSSVKSATVSGHSRQSLQKELSRYACDLGIGGLRIRFQSRFKPRRLSDKRLEGFVLKTAGKPDILIQVEVAAQLPPRRKAPRFTTIHPQDHEENWCVAPTTNGWRYDCGLENREHAVFLNRSLDRGRALMLAKKEGGFIWDLNDLVYDFLQVLLIWRLVKRGEGLIAHAAAVRDTDGRGYLFAGKSGAGKSTTARLWHKNTRADILNDDRVLLLKKGRRFLMYNPPWHGEMGAYLSPYHKPVRLDRIFFLRHGKRNVCEPLGFEKAFRRLYPAVFPVFWDVEALKNLVSLCGQVLQASTACDLSFVKNRKVIGFVRQKGRSGT